MKRLQQIKLKQVESKIQVVIFDNEGRVSDTCNTLFKIERETSLYNQFTFFQSLQAVFESMEVSESHDFPEIEWMEQIKGLFGITISKVRENKLQLVIVDKTDDYDKIVSNQQSRNDSAINEEVALLQKRITEMESQFLEFQNEELKRIQHFKNEFFASVSHEMRTPLQSITVLVQLSADRSEMLSEYLPAIKSTSDHLNSIVNDILDLSKIEAGKLSFEALDFDINEAIQNVMAGFQFSAQSKNIKLAYTAFNETLMVKSDPTWLKQVLYNLLGNSLKFTEKGQVILGVSVLSKDMDKVKIKFELDDTGIGMTDAQIKSILEPYAQADVTTAREYGGTGLGMGISIKLIEALGGELVIKSIPKKGTNMCFELHLPLGETLNLKTANEISAINIEGIRILYAEDDEVSRNVITKFLQSKNAHLTVVQSGEDLLSTLKADQFDIVISDLQLAGLRGSEALAEAGRNGIYTPFIFVSGTQPKLAPDIFTAHYTWLQKPVDLVLLEQSIAETIRLQDQFKIDLGLLIRTVGGDQQFIAEIVSTILTTLPQEITLLEKSIEASDWQSIKKIIHKIKPSIDYLGIDALSSLRKEIDDQAKELQNLSSVKHLFHSLKPSIAFALDNLTQEHS